MRHHKVKKTLRKRKVKGGDWLPSSVQKVLGYTPTTASEVLEDPEKATTEAVKKTAEAVGLDAPLSSQSTPGSLTSPEEAKLMGGRRHRKSRKSRKHKSKRRY
jgi:hypothetical protein